MASSRTGLLPAAPLAARSLARLRALPDHTLLDRVVRGRAWIPLLGVLLAGIVAMQVEVLKLGASTGRAMQRGTALQSRNELLRASVASLTDPLRIESLAGQQGMVMPAPTGLGFLSVRSGNDTQRAIANIHTPNPAAFLTQSTSNGAVALNPTTPTPATASSSVPGTATSTPGSAVVPGTIPTASSTPGSAVVPGTIPTAASTPASAPPATATPASPPAAAASPASTSTSTSTSAGPTSSPAPVAATPTQTAPSTASAPTGTVGNGR